VNIKKALIILGVLVVGLVAFIVIKSTSSAKIIFTSEAPMPIGPYSQAVLKNNILFVSGQVAVNPKNGLHDTINIYRETEQVMQNLSAILKAAECEWKDVCKVSIFLTDLKDFKTINEIYQKYLATNKPARETVQVTALPKGFHIEISLIAMP
jgi:2-iminobutanoate/2-iminopropanoate deaminase